MVHFSAMAEESTIAICLHASARTTPRIRVELRLATGSYRSLVKLYGINPRLRASGMRAPLYLMSPGVFRAEQASIFPKSKNAWPLRCAGKGICRWATSWGSSWETAPKLSRSALHRCLRRHGISRQPTTHVSRRRGKFEETTRASCTSDLPL